MLGLSGTIGQRPASQPCGAWRQAADPENIKAVTRQNYLGRVKYIDAARLRDATLPIITAQARRVLRNPAGYRGSDR